MAKKQKNILDFRDASLRLFVATLVPAIFIIIVILLSAPNKQKAVDTLFIISPFLVLGIISAIGAVACKRIAEVIADKKRALKKSNRAHRCQIYIIIVLFLLLAGLGIVLFIYLSMYFLQDKFGDDRVYSIANEDAGVNTTVQPLVIVKQQIVGGIIKIIIGIAVSIVYLVFYMRLAIASDVVRKDFSNLPKITPIIKAKKAVKVAQKTGPKTLFDDSDEDDL